MERTEMRMIRWLCFRRRKTVQYITAKTTKCRGNWGCHEKMQTEVAWTRRTKGHIVKRHVQSWWGA